MKPKYFSSLTTVIFAGVLTSHVQAQNGSWLGDSAGNWSDTTKWTGGIVANGIDNAATFGNVIAANRIITLDTDRTIGNITASDTTHDYTISGANTLTLDRTTGAPLIDVTAAARSLNINSVIAGTDGLQKNGGGTLVLGAANTYTGNTRIQTGSLALTHLDALKFSSGVTFADLNQTMVLGLRYGSTATFNTPKINLLQNRPVTINVANSGSGSNEVLTVPDVQVDNFGNVGTLNITGSNGYSLGIEKLTLLRTTNVGSNGGGLVLNPTTARVAVGIVDANLTVNIFKLTLGGTIAGNTMGAITQTASQPLSLTKSNTSTWALTGANNHTGATVIDGGVLQLGNGGTTGSLTATASITVTGANLTINRSNAFTQATGLANKAITGTGSFTQAGAGTTTLSLDNTYQGVTTISGGTLQIGNGGTTGRLTATSGITNNANLTINRSDAFSQATDLGAGVISGTGSFTQAGVGTTTLTKTNTYTGATTVSAGTLLVNGSISTSILTTVASGATIGGSGTVGALTVSTGGNINPGNSPGILNTGNFTQDGLYNAEIAGLTPGTQHDQINVTGTVDIAGGSLVTMFSGSGYMASDLIFILLNDGVDAITGTYTGLAQGGTVISYDGLDWQISYTANNTGIGTGTFTGGNDIALMAVPEPSTALLGALGVLALLRRRR